MPSFFAFDPATRVLSVTTLSVIGTYNFRMVVDMEALTDSYSTFTVNLAGKNEKCVVGVTEHQNKLTCQVGDTCTLTAAFTDPDPSDVHTFYEAYNSWDVNVVLPAYAAFSGQGTSTITLTLSPTTNADVVNNVEMRLWADDDNADAGAEGVQRCYSYWDIEVTELPNTAPTLGGVALVDKTMDNEDANLFYTLPAGVDAESGDTLTFTTSTLPGWITFVPGTRTFEFDPSIPYNSFETITVTVTDDNSIGSVLGNLAYSESFKITVTGTNEMPTWDTPVDTAQSMYYDETLTYYLPSYSDGDPSDLHVASITMGDDTSLAASAPFITELTGPWRLEFNPTFSDENSYSLKVVVEDDDSSGSGANLQLITLIAFDVEERDLAFCYRGSFSSLSIVVFDSEIL
jgi:hypothetical protein